jgi:hypothetical protein
MIAIHGVATLVAKTSTAVESNWVSLTDTEPNGETSTEITLYFATRNRGFEEEHRFALALAEAINRLQPMRIGEWGTDASDPELSPREAALEAGHS